VKEAIFHPEARAEIRQSIEFYEARLEGLGLRFLSAVEQTTERISERRVVGVCVAASALVVKGTHAGLRGKDPRDYPHNPGTQC
jgi:hypothetical protein